ncbi:MAG: NAD(P)H-hydrate dehydratase [Janthinobacterium lividum]
MIPIDGLAVLTAAAVRDAETRAVARGTGLATLMDRAGQGVATAVRRLAAGAETLVLCGPGNNGGDGWVAAAALAAAGHRVRVAALGEPATDLARAARARWAGPVERFADAAPAPVVVDALFGIGLSRPLDADVAERLCRTVGRAGLRIAVDVPSGLASDTGDAPRTAIPRATLTLALGTLKPAHVLYPAADWCGTVRLIDVGLDPDVGPMPGALPDYAIERPIVPAPDSASHKYSRGLVLVIGGAMPGAPALAALAAMHAGAGYVMLFGDADADGPPHALVRRRWSPDALAAALHGKSPDRTAIVVGPGLGKDAAARAKLAAAIDADAQLVVDGDALHLLDEATFGRFRARPADRLAVLTPHAGEFRALFGEHPGNKIDAARDAAARSGAIVAFKGPDTVIAHPDGRTRTHARGSAWLSTAGTGDVLAGTVAAMLCADTVTDPVAAAVWMHGEAARRLGPAFVADDLARALSAVRASL